MKGYALIIDVTFGALVAIFMLVAATSLMSSGYSAGIGSVSMKRTATDVVTLLDMNGTLDTMDENLIRSGVRHLLPAYLEMGINITVYNEDSDHVQDMDVDYYTDKNAFGGKHCFMTFSGTRADGFAVAEYWVAIK